MYSLVPGVRLIHYWNKENEQCLSKNLHENSKYYYLSQKVCSCNEEEKCCLL